MLSQTVMIKGDQPNAAVLTGIKESPSGRYRWGALSCQGENAASYRALWDMYWFQGSLHTMAANGTVK